MPLNDPTEINTDTDTEFNPLKSTLFAEVIRAEIPGVRHLRSQKKLMVESALDELAEFDYQLLSEGQVYLPHLIVAKSSIPAAGHGLFLNGPVKIAKGEIITLFGGLICYTDDVDDLAQRYKVTSDYIRSYLRSLGRAYSAGGRVIIGDAAFKNYSTSGPGSFINHSDAITANTRFKALKELGIAIVANQYFELAEGEVLELTVNYGKALQGHVALAGLAACDKSFLKFESQKQTLGSLQEIKSIGGAPYSDTDLCKVRLSTMRSYFARLYPIINSQLTDEALLDIFETYPDDWRETFSERYPPQDDQIRKRKTDDPHGVKKPESWTIIRGKFDFFQDKDQLEVKSDSKGHQSPSTLIMRFRRNP